MLALLAIEGERSRYDLMKSLSKAIGYIWAPAKTQLYALLPRLDERGLATSRTVREGARPEKKLFQITSAGRSELDSWLAAEPESEETFYLRFFVGGLVPPDVLIEHVAVVPRADTAAARGVPADRAYEHAHRQRLLPLLPAPPRHRALGAPPALVGLGARASWRPHDPADPAAPDCRPLSGGGRVERGVATVPGAESDVRLLAQQLEAVHPDLFASVPRARFRSAVETAAARADELSENELLVELMRIAALPGIGNGHTGIFPGDPQHRRDLHLYPLRLYAFPDGTYVVDEKGSDGLVGARITAVGGVPTPRSRSASARSSRTTTRATSRAICRTSC